MTDKQYDEKIRDSLDWCLFILQEPLKNMGKLVEYDEKKEYTANELCEAIADALNETLRNLIFYYEGRADFYWFVEDGKLCAYSWYTTYKRPKDVSYAIQMKTKHAYNEGYITLQDKKDFMLAASYLNDADDWNCLRLREFTEKNGYPLF